MTYRWILIIPILGILLTSAPQLYSQVQTVKGVIGGGVTTSDGHYTVQGTLGQGVVGQTVGTATTASQGFWYQLPHFKLSTFDETTYVAGESATRLSLHSTPNPFTHSTTLSLELLQEEELTLTMHDISGRIVQTLLEGKHRAGTINLELHESGLAAGTYQVVLQTGENQESIQILLLK